MITTKNIPAILIVDDIPENLIAIEKLLLKFNINIVKADSGKKALEAAQRNDFSLIILDVMMPGMNGYEVADYLKNDERTKGIPIIFLTAMDKSESQEIEGYSKGAVDFIFKPFNEIILLSKVNVLLELNRMRKNYTTAMLTQKEGKPQILIVDDIPENLIALEKLLRKEDVDIIKANSGNEALSATLYNDFALIILDVQMPEMDGYEVANFLKTEDRTATIPIIFVTAIDRDSSKEIKGYDKGAVDFIFKPFNEFILRSKVRIFLEIYKMRIGLEELVAERTQELRESNIKLRKQIVENEEARTALQQAKSYLNSVFNSISAALISIDADGNIIEMNQAAQKISGMPPKDAYGCPFEKVFPHYAEYIGEIQKRVSEKEIFEKTKIFININGEIAVKNLAVYPLIAGKGQGAVIRIDDVTEQVRIEEMMIQSEKILTLGGLAAGMAHEINNPLAGILQNIQVIKNRIIGDMPKNRQAAEKCGTSIEAIEAYMKERMILAMFDSIEESSKRAAKIISNMLSFSRKSENQIVSCDLKELIDKTVKLAENDYDLKKKYDFRQMKIIREDDPDMPAVPCDSTKIQQVILNLLKNAAQAISGQDNRIEPPRISLRTFHDEYMARIEVEDNGPGMEKTIQDRVFEPFYTTKGVGVGTGLGLSVSHFIITENHKGIIEVQSSPGKGTKFIIQIPLNPSSTTVI
ncbi:MAG: hypothetical protein C0403_10005 [Desulfobacterium sp.]|nr:hypothetical protein [Desulfobacterium sp.]